jgi:peptidoglycan hydrolase-like protein with peptidoglycan-binding domain
MLCIRQFAWACRGLGAAAMMLLAVLAVPPGASASDHGAAASPHTVAPIVRFGDGYSQPAGSPRVRRIQRRLHALGYAAGPIDGRYGPLTKGAASRFQADHGLQIDGEIGPITSRHLRRATSVVRYGSGYARPNGSRRVRAIQQRLRTLGYETGPVDGRFGPLTSRAVARFQAAHSLAADGEVGPRTRARLIPRRKDASPSTVVDQTRPRPTTIPDLLAPAPPGGAGRLLPRVAVPHAPPAGLLLLAIALVGVAMFTASYMRTRARLAKVRRGSPAAPVANGNAERGR